MVEHIGPVPFLRVLFVTQVCDRNALAFVTKPPLYDNAFLVACMYDVLATKLRRLGLCPTASAMQGAFQLSNGSWTFLLSDCPPRYLDVYKQGLAPSLYNKLPFGLRKLPTHVQSYYAENCYTLKTRA